MTLIHVLLFFHIMAVIIWIGAGITLELLGWKATMSGKREEIYQMISISEWLAPRVFMPAALSTLVFGILIVAVGKSSFSDLWIIIAIVGFLVTAFIGGAFIGRLSKELSQKMTKNKQDKKIDKMYQRITLISRIDFAILLIIVFDMVIKPKATDSAFFVVSIIFFLLVATLSWRQYGKY